MAFRAEITDLAYQGRSFISSRAISNVVLTAGGFSQSAWAGAVYMAYGTCDWVVGILLVSVLYVLVLAALYYD